MSRCIAITLPSSLGDGIYETMRAEVTQAFNRANNRNVSLTETLLDNAVDTAINQAQKSAMERHNLKWEPEHGRLMVLDQSGLEAYGEEDADTAVENLEGIALDSAKISGKSLVALVAAL